MQDFAMRTYNYIVDFFMGVQIYGRYCHTNIKAGSCKNMYGPSHFQ